jgi:hypothetical protein
LRFASSIICFISSALGAAAVVVVVVVVAGLEAVVVVVAGLELVGAFGEAEGVWARARDAIAKRVAVSDKVMGLMV